MKNFGRVCLPCFLAVSLVLLPTLGLRAAEAAAPAKPVAVVSIASADEVLGDLLYLTETAGSGDFGRLMTLLASPYTATMDKSKPLGAYLVVGDDQKAAAVAFLPIKDVDMLLAVLKEQMGEPEELADGVLEIGADRREPLFLKKHGDWLYASNKRELLRAVPDDPVKLLGRLNEKYTVAVQANVANLPEELREHAAAQLRKGFEENFARDIEDEQARTLARKIGRRWLEEMIRLINETETVTLGWEIDAESHRTYLDLSIRAVADSKLAGEFGVVERSPSAFAGFLHPEAAATMHAAGKTAQTDVEMSLLLLDALHAELMKDIDKSDDLKTDEDRAQAKDIVERALDIARQTAKARKMNFGGALIVKPGAIGAVVGGFVADGRALDAVARDFWKLARKTDPHTPDLKFQTETYQDVTLRETHVPIVEAKPEARKLLGDPMEVTLGTGQQAVYLAFGKQSTELLKQVIDQSRKTGPEQKFAPFEASIALKPIFELAAAREEGSAGAKAALDALKQVEGSDRITLTVLPIERGVSLRLEVGEGVVAAAGRVAKAVQRMRAQRARPRPAE